MSEEICVDPKVIASVTLQLRNWAARLSGTISIPSTLGSSQVLAQYASVGKKLFDLLNQYSSILAADAGRVDGIAAKMAGIDRSIAVQFEQQSFLTAGLGTNKGLNVTGIETLGR